ncbi:hypothetical protein, partial [Gordonia alkanivorans]|uniref:hypothetical protein n=1 Tax=Gordonia alkanivorans TaxID=84096 RepID=UPI0005AA457F
SRKATNPGIASTAAPTAMRTVTVAPADHPDSIIARARTPEMAKHADENSANAIPMDGRERPRV